MAGEGGMGATTRDQGIGGARLTIRIDLANGARIGPGKVALLEAVARTGSIAAAARDLGMSYRRAWLLIDAVGSALGRAAVDTHTGGRGHGGARLTEAGEALVTAYREMERRCCEAGLPALNATLGAEGQG
jgi:molybdate transport system regulatory protein